MARAGLYVRVSTEEQAKEGFSVAAQLAPAPGFCRSQGLRRGDVKTSWTTATPAKTCAVPLFSG